jgi:hypothetical protein
MAFFGIGKLPAVDLAPALELDGLAAVDREIAYALVTVPTSYTGGFHRTTARDLPGVQPAGQDYGEVIRGFDEAERRRYLSLNPELAEDLSLAECLELVPNTRQKQYLKIAHGVYFPWQTHVQIFPRSAADVAVARAFAVTLQFIAGLPFASVRRVDILGVDPYQYPIIHRDPWEQPARPAEFMHLTPRGDRKLFVYDPDARVKHYLPPFAAYFNNYDYHGADPMDRFGYSLRVEGEFAAPFRRWLAEATV